MPSSSPQAPSRTVHRSWIPLVLIALVLGTAFTAVYLGIQRAPEPRGLPVAVVGAPLAETADQAWGDRVDVTTVDTLARGVELVRDGEAVAAVEESSPTTLRLEYAGGAGLSESAAVRTLVDALARGGGSTVEAGDVVPLARYDSRGLAAFYVVFGVTLASFILAQLLAGGAAVFSQLHHRLLVLAGFAVLIGLVAATIAGPFYGTLTAPFPLLTLSLALLSAAVAFGTTAMASWLGPPGISLAVLVFTVLGNATSGATIGYDLLPRWAQVASAMLPNGAATRLLRDVGYFDGSRAWPSVGVLVAWSVAGIGLTHLHRLQTDGRHADGDRAEVTTPQTPRHASAPAAPA